MPLSSLSFSSATIHERSALPRGLISRPSASSNYEKQPAVKIGTTRTAKPCSTARIRPQSPVLRKLPRKQRWTTKWSSSLSHQKHLLQCLGSNSPMSSIQMPSNVGLSRYHSHTHQPSLTCQMAHPSRLVLTTPTCTVALRVALTHSHLPRVVACVVCLEDAGVVHWVQHAADSHPRLLLPTDQMGRSIQTASRVPTLAEPSTVLEAAESSGFQRER